MASSTHGSFRERAKESVQKETRLPGKESRGISAMGVNTTKECPRLCEETIALRQYVEGVPGAELLKWVVRAGLKLKIGNGILCSKLWGRFGGNAWSSLFTCNS